MITRADAPPALHVWLLTADAAKHCRMSQRYLLGLARAGQIRGEQVGGKGGHWRFHIDWLNSFLETSGRSVASMPRRGAA